MNYKIGDHYKCPICHSFNARIIWMSSNGKTIAVQCPEKHYVKTQKLWGKTTEIRKRNTVMIIDLEENNVT